MKIKTTLMASTAALLVLSGAAFAASPMAGETLAADQTFTYQDIDESPSIDPGMVEDVSGSAVVRNLFEGLMNQDADGNLIPGVATGYDLSDDKMTYTFHLRADAKWSNGDPVTAGDFVKVKASYKLSAAAKTAAKKKAAPKKKDSSKPKKASTKKTTTKKAAPKKKAASTPQA